MLIIHTNRLTQKFRTVNPKPVPVESRTSEWYKRVVCEALGYKELKPWQLENIMHLCSGKDVFLTVATGGGKSTLIQGPIVADLAAGINSIGLALTPTKCLADDQVRLEYLKQNNKLTFRGYQARSANEKLIPALALHEDTVRDAQNATPPRDLFDEVAKGKWSLVFLGPEMITSPAFERLLKTKESVFLSRFRYFTLDESHLTEDWSDFCSSFSDICRLRNRFYSSIVWLALSATIARGSEARALKTRLGFDPGCQTVHLPVDRPSITYAPRFLQYSTSGREFLDLSWVIPRSVREPSDIPTTIVFIEHIECGNRVDAYLTSLIPKSFVGNRGRLIATFNALMSMEARKRDAMALRDGSETRIIICTDTGAFGLDIPQVQVVIIVQPNRALYRTLCQQMGRIRGSGLAVVYFKKWMSHLQTSKDATAKRERAEQVLVEFANSTGDRCPRAVNCEKWGEVVGNRDGVSVPCCNKHDPQIDVADGREVGARRREQRAKALARRRVAPVQPRSNQEFRPLDARFLQPAALAMLQSWRRSNWRTVGALRGPLMPEHLLISDKMLKHLCKRLHVCTSLERLRRVVWDWEFLNIGGWDEKLFGVVKGILEVSVKLQPQIVATGKTLVKRAPDSPAPDAKRIRIA
ncbi:hypothetical protein FS749_016479 [Ceratobasidium sp. UAMH 11750]|nr:hypothetical protein FS749_016479 [Ceratobasidium sp. UAMH 11750]